MNDLNSKELEILNVTKHTRQQSQIVAIAQIQVYLGGFGINQIILNFLKIFRKNSPLSAEIFKNTFKAASQF